MKRQIEVGRLKEGVPSTVNNATLRVSVRLNESHLQITDLTEDEALELFDQLGKQLDSLTGF